ncbi:hypothetical protein GCM10028824_13870 [Hymenobacter segetis]
MLVEAVVGAEAVGGQQLIHGPAALAAKGQLRLCQQADGGVGAGIAAVRAGYANVGRGRGKGRRKGHGQNGADGNPKAPAPHQPLA